MRILIDTHIWLWMLAEPARLGALRQVLLDERNELLLSAASSWEISIKYALRRLPLPEPPASYIPGRLQTTGVVPLQISHNDTFEVASLPVHHRDPFDRLLIAQARNHNLQLMTADEQFQAYDVPLIQAP